MLFERIRSLRESSKRTQRELAEYLKVSQDTYLQYENGTIEITPEHVAKLAALYGTSADYLLGLTDERKPYPPSRYPINTK